METGKGSSQQHLQAGYQLAYTKACAELAGRKPEDIAQASGAQYDGGQTKFALKYLMKLIQLVIPVGRLVTRTGMMKYLWRLKLCCCIIC